MANAHPLETPKSSIAVALSALVAGVVAPIVMPQHIGWIVAAGYGIFALILWLCRNEIRAAIMNLRGAGSRNRLPGDFWIVAGCALLVFVLTTYLLIGVPSSVAQTAPTNSQTGHCNAQNSPGATIDCSKKDDEPSPSSPKDGASSSGANWWDVCPPNATVCFVDGHDVRFHDNTFSTSSDQCLVFIRPDGVAVYNNNCQKALPPTNLQAESPQAPAPQSLLEKK